MANAGHNPNTVQIPSFPWTAQGNKIVDSKGKTVAVLMCFEPVAVAQFLTTLLNRTIDKASE